MGEAVEIEFFSPKTLAQRWSRSRQYVYDLIAAGELTATPWGRIVQIHRAEVERFERKMLCEKATPSDGTGENSSPSSTNKENGKDAIRLMRLTKTTPSARSAL